MPAPKWFGETWFAARWWSTGWHCSWFGPRLWALPSTPRGVYWHGSYFAKSWFAGRWWPATSAPFPLIAIEPLPAGKSAPLVFGRRAARCVAYPRRIQRCTGSPRRVSPCDSFSEWLPWISGNGRRHSVGMWEGCMNVCGGPIRRGTSPWSGGTSEGIFEGKRVDGTDFFQPFSPMSFAIRHWLADLSRFYSANDGAPVSWRACPGGIVQTLDDYDSLCPTYFGVFATTLGAEAPWACGASGVPYYVENAVGEDGNTHAAILRLPFFVDAIERYAAAFAADLLGNGCCRGEFVSIPSYLSYFNQISNYGRIAGGTTPEFPGYAEIDAYFAGISELVPYPFRSADGSSGVKGRIRGIDTAGLFEIYFSSPFSDPWDGVFPTVTGGWIIYQLDPQGLSEVETMYDWEGIGTEFFARELRLTNNSHGTISKGLSVFEQTPDVVTLVNADTQSINTSVSGYQYPPTDPFNPCCDETIHSTTNVNSSEDVTVTSALRLEKIPRV